MDLDHPLNCLTFNLLRAGRSAARGFETRLRQLGLTSPQFTALAFLSGFGEIAVGELAARSGSDRTTMTRNLDLLRKRGWIEPAPSKDQRVHSYRLTDAGRETLQAALPLWRAYQRNLVEGLGRNRAAELLDVLGRI